MKNTIRIATLIGAIVMVAALSLTAFAARGVDPSAFATLSSSSPSDDPTPESTPSPSPSSDDEAIGVDISGNCDEAEHAGDPECQGGPSR